MPNAVLTAPLHFLGYAPCPFKQTFKEHMDETLDAYRRRTGISVDYHIPMVCGDYDAYDDLWQAESMDALPDVIAGMGFRDFFKPAFRRRFVEKGCFQNAWPQTIQPMFAKSGFQDPEGAFSIYSVWSYVLLIDQKKLGSRPVPRVWSDLLDPQYRNDIITNGSRDHRVAEVPLMYFFKEHGEDGLVRLAANIRDFWHPAQMVKAAGAAGANGAAIYMIPTFFAQARHRPQETPVVWPEDGAFTSPLYLLVKAGKRPESEIVVQTMTGRAFGEKCSRSFFPSFHPEVDNRLPQGASFQWLGWDYIKHHDLDAIKEHALGVFLNAWDQKGKG